MDAAAVREALCNSIDGYFKVEWIRGCNESLERLRREGVQRGDQIAAILVDLFCPTAPESKPLTNFSPLRRRYRS